MQEKRAQETPEASATRRICMSIGKKARAQETAETRTNRRISNREKMQQNRAQETPDTRTNRRILNRKKMQQNRAQLTYSRSKCCPPYFHEDEKQKSQSTRDQRNTY
jgi:hypothetical protein